MANKIKFGLKNAHYATMTVDDTTGAITYGTPVAIPGSVELQLEPRGDMIEFYADDMLYYSAPNNQGYDGTFNVALIPEQFAIDCLGEEKNGTDNVLTEKSNSKPKPFALMFEFDGDVKATRHVLYNCTANRPTQSSSTKNDSPEPQPDELTFVASARPGDYAVKTKTTTNTPSDVYNAWYDAVYDASPVAVTGVTLEPASFSLTMGEYQQLATTIEPINATNQAVTYSSSDESIATVTSDGLVEAIAAGSATITVTTEDGSFTDTASVTVS